MLDVRPPTFLVVRRVNNLSIRIYLTTNKYSNTPCALQQGGRIWICELIFNDFRVHLGGFFGLRAVMLMPFWSSWASAGVLGEPWGAQGAIFTNFGDLGVSCWAHLGSRFG